METNYKNVDEYIASFPEPVKHRMQELREIILQNAPGATETISYKIPAFNLNGYLVYFAGFKKHIGLYSVPNAVDTFKERCSIYKTGKGSIQFPLDRPLPIDLIADIVKYSVEQNKKKVKK